MKALCTLFALGSLATPASAQHHEEHGPHHLSIFLGGTAVSEEFEEFDDGEEFIVEEDFNVFTIALDYEYRLTEFWGAGFVAEHAFGGFDATTILAVADLHLWRGFMLQVGPGVEFTPEANRVVGRIGGIYEFELRDGYTIAPQLHADITGEATAFVYGVAFGRAF